MKKTGICPKCSSNNVVAVNTIGNGHNIALGTTLLSAVFVNRYVCCDCGYTEEWVKQKDLEKIKKKYSK